MIKHGDTIVWSASDLTSATSCEYGFLRALDRKLGRAEPLAAEVDPLQDQIAKLGNAHEARVLKDLQSVHGDPAPGCGVVTIERAASATAEALNALVDVTKAAFALDPDVVFQAGFFDGEFHGYADFVRRTPDGWVVIDTKIARKAKTSALLQIAAYADQLEVWGLPLAPTAELILGSGETQSFPLADILPVFRERRARLRTLIADHLAVEAETAWDTDGVLACGSCADCSLAIEETHDLLLVANLRRTQRQKLRAEEISTVSGLVAADTAPAGMSPSTFEALRAQAALQWAQMQSKDGGAEKVSYEVFDPKALHALPAPSDGDLFFDFEGDPMFGAGADGRWGLEYLWGVLRARKPDGSLGDFCPLWADDREAERQQLITFLDEVCTIRSQHPDMHIYHYAPYEITALKRLVAEHKTHEEVLDDLLRHGVFVDLYAVVRASVRVSQPSYSIKKLEPLYMSHDRAGEVTKGDDSIAQYHLYRELIAQGDDAARSEAALLKESLLEYNHYDCESTLELRDWLLQQAADVPVVEPDPSETDDLEEQAPSVDDEDLRRLKASLLARSGPAARSQRSADQQTWAMLEGALGYHQREDRPFWWAHFDRLLTPAQEWADTKDVIQFTEVTVVEPWATTGRKLPRRTLSVRGVLGPGSTLQAPAKVGLLYDVPAPDGVKLPVRGLRGSAATGEVTDLEVLDEGTVRATIVEAVKKEQRTFDQSPMAAVPGPPPNAAPIVAAIRSVAEQCDAQDELLPIPAIDILARRPPRLRTLASLPHSTDRHRDLVTGLLDLDGSYLAVQGPPGTGKTYLGSRVIRELVDKHHWKVGVVGQSHAVVENMLDAVVKAGLDPNLVGKRDKKSTGPQSTWVGVSGANVKLKEFCNERSASGYVIGGTAWTFTGAGVDPGSLDLLVIDESGQFSLAATVGVSVAAHRLLLLGDPQQLPQVSQGHHGEPVCDSALSWVIGDHATMPRHLGYFLETSYRMHPEVCAVISRLSYDGELVSAPEASERSLDGVRPGVDVVRLAHRDNSVSSVPEADEVVRQVLRLRGLTWHDPEDSGGPRPLGVRDFLVVAPYNAQRQLISARLAAAGLAEVRVGTVDKFQGQEAPVVIVSMTASSAEDVPRGMEFLLNRNRVNVAVSRAQWLAVLIRSEELTAHMPATPERLLELGGFIGLCSQ